MAKDTIYLCNFRVSVDGDWLCLRELTDVQIAQQHQLISPQEEDETKEEEEEIQSERSLDDKNPAVVERTNLLNVSKLVIKELIDSSFCHGRMLDMDHVPLQQFFIIMEHILRHGLKSKKGILAQKKEYWNMLEQVERYMLDAAEITATVKELPEIKTLAGRGRAWLRLALMQKKLSDYFRCILERKEELLSEYYESYAFMMEDEGAIFSGLLVGLNIIDCNFCLKEEDLDYQLGVIDFSLYLKNSNKPDSFDGENEQTREQPNMMALLDQKNYIEELNRHLNATVTNLQQKLESFTTSNALMKEDLAIAKNNILALQEENQILQAERDSLLDENTRKLQNMKQDLEVERETYSVSKEGLDSMYIDTAKQLEQEVKLRKEGEKELELQMAMKAEMEVAMKLLEKDIHEKQDTMMSLRRQLEEIKNINLEMYKKLQECQGSLQHKTELVAKLEHKTNQMAATIRDMEAREKTLVAERQAMEEKSRRLGQQLAEKDQQRSTVETDLKLEREWRISLDKTLKDTNEKLSETHSQMAKLKHTEKEYEQLLAKHKDLKQVCDEQEKALAEMGSHLSEEKLKIDDLKEVTKLQVDATWADDKEVNDCQICKKSFSLARRKHHCRKCGGIFCGQCSDNTMHLPSSSKPERVCDNCHTVLLERYSTKTT